MNSSTALQLMPKDEKPFFGTNEEHKVTAHSESVSSTEEETKKSSLDHMPDGPWVFDETVAVCFRDMLRRSIPGFETMRRLVFEMGKDFIQKPGSWIVDIGCSQGDGAMRFLLEYGDRVRYYGIDTSLPMLEKAQERFNELEPKPYIHLEQADITTGFPPISSNLTLLILTLQFVDLKKRQELLNSIYTNMATGGALILVEKLRSCDSTIEMMMTERHTRFKLDMGYSIEAIERKKLSLQGVMIPLSEKQNLCMIKKAGFRTTECFWRNLNFAGWMAIK